MGWGTFVKNLNQTPKYMKSKKLPWQQNGPQMAYLREWVQKFSKCKPELLMAFFHQKEMAQLKSFTPCQKNKLSNAETPVNGMLK